MPQTLESLLISIENKSPTNNTETFSLLQMRALINQNTNLTRPEKNQILWSLQKLKTNDLLDSNEATMFKQAIANSHNFKDANRYLKSLQLEYQKQLLTNQIDSIVTYKKQKKLQLYPIPHQLLQRVVIDHIAEIIK